MQLKLESRLTSVTSFASVNLGMPICYHSEKVLDIEPDVVDVETGYFVKKVSFRR